MGKTICGSLVIAAWLISWTAAALNLTRMLPRWLRWHLIVLRVKISDPQWLRLQDKIVRAGMHDAARR